MNEAPPPALDRDAAAALIEPLTDILIRAGAAILAVNRSAMKIDGKTDGSPVTEADLAADRIIAEGLAEVASGIPSLSEERADPDRKSTRLNSSHANISYAVFCLKKKKFPLPYRCNRPDHHPPRAS